MTDRVMRVMRIGAVPYLNVRPLVFGFEQGVGRGRIQVTYDVPSRLAARIAAGELDVALLSTVELGRIPGLCVVPGIAIGSRGPVRSVLLVSRVPFEDVRTLALDPESLTGNALARILLAELCGARPVCVSPGTDLAEALEHADAAVRIGDKALFDPVPAGCQVLDLGEAWTGWTGRPFVYAVWAAREGILDRSLYDLMHASRAQGMRVIEAIAQDYTWRGRTDPETSRTYLAEHVRYRLGGPEVAALRLFLEVCVRHGLLEAVPEVRLARFRETACDALGS